MTKVNSGTGDQQDRVEFRTLNAPGDGAFVFAGYAQSFLILADGSVWGWGNNEFEQVLEGGASTILEPAYLPDATGAIAIGTGQRHSLALLDNFQQCPSAIQPITVKEAPPATIDRSGDFLTAMPTGVSYQWFFNGNAVFNQDTATLKMQQNGIYQVEITYANGCSRLSEAQEFFTTDIYTANLPAISLFPNPATEGVFLELSEATGQAFELMLMDARGKEIGRWEAQQILEPLWIDMADQAEGMYVLRVQTEGYQKSLRFLKN